MSNEVKTYTLEEVNAYRAEVYRLLISWGEYKEDADYICDYDPKTCLKTTESIIYNWSRVMWQTPEEYAELMCM